MAADPLDGDVRRLRYSGRGGSNGDPIGYSPVRSQDMTDPAFTLTPLDIRKQEFRKTLRGYDTLGVEDFQIRVADALERAIRERQVLEERGRAGPAPSAAKNRRGCRLGVGPPPQGPGRDCSRGGPGPPHPPRPPGPPSQSPPPPRGHDPVSRDPRLPDSHGRDTYRAF